MADPAFEACASDMEHVPANAYESCAEYVRAAPSESSANIAKAKDWLQVHAVYRPYVRYLKSLTSDDNASFIVYRPDMSIELPQINQADEFGSIKIERKFGNTTEEAMLREAEAVYPPPAVMISEVIGWWAGWPYPSAGEMEPYWGTPGTGDDGGNEIRTVTPRAVRYYYDLATGYRKEPKIGPRMRVSSAALTYESSIRSADRYEHAGKSFENVWVVDATISWTFICGGLCGHSIQRNKVVVLDKDGEVIALYRDAPENSETEFF